MTVQQIRRFTAIAGIVGVVLYILSALLISDLPGINTPPQQLASYFTAHSTQMLLEGFVWGGVGGATICFLTGLWSMLRQAEGEPGLLAMLGFGAGLVTFAIVLAGLVPVLALGYRASSLTPSNIRLLTDAVLLGTTLSAFPTAVSVAAFSALMLRTGTVARWIGTLGFVVVAAHLVAAGSFAHDGIFSPSGVPVYVAPVLYYLWMLALSVEFLRVPRALPVGATQTSTGSRVS